MIFMQKWCWFHFPKYYSFILLFFFFFNWTRGPCPQPAPPPCRAAAWFARAEQSSHAERSAGAEDTGAGAVLLPASRVHEESKHFGQGKGKASATAVPGGMRAGAAGQDGGWEGPGPWSLMERQEGALGQHRSLPAAVPSLGTRWLPGTASLQPRWPQGGGGAQLSRKLVFRPWGRTSISVSVNLGHILISSIVKKPNQTKPNQTKSNHQPSAAE